MRREPIWISRRALLLLHHESLATFGGSSGIRDEGLLDSALARPLNLQNYVPACTLTDLAASYAFGLARNHAFVDGNKRAAFLAIGLFLGLNGRELTATPAEAIEVMLALARGDIGEKELSLWIVRFSGARKPE